MAEFINQNKVKVEEIGSKVKVPENTYARLMYYLSCVETVINYDKENFISDYKHYDSLNATQKKVIVNLCELFNPSLLNKIGAFIVDEKLLPDNTSNQFFKITDQKIGIHKNKNIMIGGQSVKISKIMVCNKNWLDRNYFTPIKTIYKIEILADSFAKVILNSLKNVSD